MGMCMSVHVYECMYICVGVGVGVRVGVCAYRKSNVPETKDKQKIRGFYSALAL